MTKRRKDGAHPVDVYVGGRIRSRRMQLGKSQSWLADKLGVTFQQVQKQERGINRVSASAMLTIAVALNVPPAFFFKGAPGSSDGDPGADDALRTFTTSRDGLAIVAAWKDLKPKMRSVFADLVRTMAEA